MAALQGNNLDELKRMYENFFRESLSTGLHGLHFDMVQIYMNPEKPPSKDDLNIFIENCALAARNFLLSCPGTDVNKLIRPPVGNPYGYLLNGVEIYPCAEYHYTFSEKIRILLEDIDSPTILELGGGFGGLAYYCCRDIANLKFICIDLPENAALQAYFLKSCFPNKTVKLFGDVSIGDDWDILIMPNNAIESLSDNSVDLVFNSYSLAEMGLDSIKNYIDIICRVASKYFYHLNHVYWEVSADNFPVDLEKFQLLFRNPTNWGKDPRAYKIDQHEFLYKVKKLLP
jgi:hypothetical protein